MQATQMLCVNAAFIFLADLQGLAALCIELEI